MKQENYAHSYTNASITDMQRGRPICMHAGINFVYVRAAETAPEAVRLVRQTQLKGVFV